MIVRATHFRPIDWLGEREWERERDESVDQSRFLLCWTDGLFVVMNSQRGYTFCLEEVTERLALSVSVCVCARSCAFGICPIHLPFTNSNLLNHYVGRTYTVLSLSSPSQSTWASSSPTQLSVCHGYHESRDTNTNRTTQYMDMTGDKKHLFCWVRRRSLSRSLCLCVCLTDWLNVHVGAFITLSPSVCVYLSSSLC